MRILWGPAYELGILVIDQQHKRIVDYINELDRLADQVRSGGVAAQVAAGLVVGAGPDAVATWATEWGAAVAGPRG